MVFKNLTLSLACVAGVAALPVAAHAQSVDSNVDGVVANPAERATYADLVSLTERSDMVVRAEIRRQIRLEAERAPGLAPGFARLYVEARTIALIAGRSAVGESLAYLVDVPLDARGKVPKLKRKEMLLFADTVPSRPGFIQLTGKYAQLDYSPELEARLRPVITAVVANDAPPVVTDIRDALAVPGTLTGESETQIFLETTDGSPVSISVLRRPRQMPVWGVSWGEIIDSAARPPQYDSLRWYRLACTLPPELPSSTNLARDRDARALAEIDYAYVMEQLGPCQRAITDSITR